MFFQFFPPILKTKPNRNSNRRVISEVFLRSPLPDTIILTKPTENKQYIILTEAAIHLDFTEDYYSAKYSVSLHLMFKIFGFKRLPFILKVINYSIFAFVPQCLLKHFRKPGYPTRKTVTFVLILKITWNKTSRQLLLALLQYMGVSSVYSGPCWCQQ